MAVQYALAACDRGIPRLKRLLFDTSTRDNSSVRSTNDKSRLTIGLILCSFVWEESRGITDAGTMTRIRLKKATRINSPMHARCVALFKPNRLRKIKVTLKTGVDKTVFLMRRKI